MRILEMLLTQPKKSLTSLWLSPNILVGYKIFPLNYNWQLKILMNMFIEIAEFFLAFNCE